jgi:hypothetical protein
LAEETFASAFLVSTAPSFTRGTVFCNLTGLAGLIFARLNAGLILDCVVTACMCCDCAVILTGDGASTCVYGKFCAVVNAVCA